ncbi:CB068 protein, partial [Semnornis frantzii]|nr:CB068 protein [Semnornis frantzii]
PRMETAVGWRCRPGGRLDMSHGFVRHIRHNQIARDAYERAVRQARGRARGRLPPAAPRPRRPDQQVYRPRRNGEHRGGGTGRHPGHRGGARWGPAGDRLLQGDSAEEVTRRVCARCPLEPALRRALCQRVQDELSKRRGTG